MTVGGGKSTRIQFVNGPSLGRGGDFESRNTRSALIRRLVSEKQSRYRREEESKRGLLIAQRQAWDRYLAARWCACTGTVMHQAQSQEERPRSSEILTTGTRTSLTVPQTRNSDGIFGICGWGGGLRVSNQTQGSTAPTLSLRPVTGRADPFSSVDPNLGPGVDSLLQHAVMDIWPNFRHADYAGRCYHSWVSTNRENKLLIYSTLWAASCHRDVLRISYGSNPVLNIQDQLYYKGRVLRLLRDHVANFTKEDWRDGVIIAILYLAVNKAKRHKLTHDPSPFTPPFMDIQSLSFYGSQDYHTLH